MDPDPNGLYTKPKQQRLGIGATSRVTDSSHGDANKSSVKYPTDGWSTAMRGHKWLLLKVQSHAEKFSSRAANPT